MKTFMSYRSGMLIPTLMTLGVLGLMYQFGRDTSQRGHTVGSLQQGTRYLIYIDESVPYVSNETVNAAANGLQAGGFGNVRSLGSARSPLLTDAVRHTFEGTWTRASGANIGGANMIPNAQYSYALAG